MKKRNIYAKSLQSPKYQPKKIPSKKKETEREYNARMARLLDY